MSSNTWFSILASSNEWFLPLRNLTRILSLRLAAGFLFGTWEHEKWNKCIFLFCGIALKNQPSYFGYFRFSGRLGNANLSAISCQESQLVSDFIGQLEVNRTVKIHSKPTFYKSLPVGSCLNCFRFPPVVCAWVLLPCFEGKVREIWLEDCRSLSTVNDPWITNIRTITPIWDDQSRYPGRRDLWIEVAKKNHCSKPELL